MKTTLTQFITYLEKLARLNVDIAHNPETNPRFIRFYDASNIESAVRNKIKNVPCIVVKDYDFSFVDPGDNLQKSREMEFMVIDKLGRGADTEDVYQVWERTEEIGDEFIVKMQTDKRAMREQGIIGFNMNGVRGVPVDLGVGGLYGTSYTIRINSVRNNDVDADKWTEE